MKFKKHIKLVLCLTESQFKMLQNVMAGWLVPISRKKMMIQEREGRQEQISGAKSQMGEYWDPKH